MLPKSGYNIGFFRLLIEVLQTLDVRKVLLFVCVLREGNGNMFTGNPLIEVVFNLNLESMNREEEVNTRTYNSQDKGNR